MADKKYYWLKLKEDFFEEKQIKYLRNLPDGDKLVIAYLKMQLKSLRTEGFIKYDSILPSNEEELAMILDEDINIVKLMIGALLKTKAIEILDDGSFYMIAMQDLVGKEGESAERVRKFRERKKQEETKLLQSNSGVTKCNTEIDIDIEKELDIKKEKKKFQKPTIDEIKKYCFERKNNINAEQFIDYYESNGWKVGKNAMKDWKACIRTWEQRNKSNNKKSILEEWLNE